MGNTKSDIIYSVPICDKMPGESNIYRSPLCVDSLVVTPHPEIQTLQDAILKSIARHRERKCLGTRFFSKTFQGQTNTQTVTNALSNEEVSRSHVLSGLNLTTAANVQPASNTNDSAIRNNEDTQSENNLTQGSKIRLNSLADLPITEKVYQKDFGGAKSDYDWEKRVKWIHNCTHLSYTEKIQMIEIENKKFQLQKTQLLQNRNILGMRRQVSEGEYCWKTYNDLENTVMNLAVGIEWFQLAEEIEDLKLIGIWSRSREEYVIVDSACQLYGNVTVPLSESINGPDFTFILEDTQISTIFCGVNELGKLSRMIIRSIQDQNNNTNISANEEPKPILLLSNLRNLVVFEDEIPIHLQHFFAEERGINILTLKTLIDKGATLPPLPIPKISPQNVATFAYTTREDNGKPIAALITHRNLISFLGILWNISSLKPEQTDIYVSYLPLHHIYEKVAILAALYAGAAIGFYSGNISTLVDDMVELRPTIFCSVPSFYNKLYASIEDKYFKKVGSFEKWINEKAIETKLQKYKSSPVADSSNLLYDNLLFNTIRNSLGGKLRLAYSSSAPLLPHVHQMLSYGCTQSTGPAFMTSSMDSSEGHVGGPTLNTEFKIQDVYSMGYTTEDKDENGQKRIRGELCLRGPCVFDGYFREEEQTAKAIDKNGWFHTGDIVELRPNGSVKVIDSRKSIFKIPQGEYVCPEKLERIYQRCISISDIFVYGSSFQKFLVAIVVPRKDFVDSFAREHGFVVTSYEDNCRNPLIKVAVMNDIQTIARRERLYPFEVVGKIHIEVTPFSILGLISPSNQLKRQLAYQQFKQAINLLNEFA